MRDSSEKICTEYQNTHLYSTTFFFENLAVYEIYGEIWYSWKGQS
jgi:hypothetical protein